MTYEIEWTRQARRALELDLPQKVAAACAEFVYGALAENPYRVGKALRDEFKGRHSARRGEFRVIYEIHDDRIAVLVVTIRHRRDAYR